MLPTNETIEEVFTGEVRSARRHVTLISNAIGSCIAVMVVDHERRTGGIAHVMLPGNAAPARSDDHCLRYAENGIDELLRQMEALGSSKADLTAVLAGGGNVLQRPNDTICSMNIESVLTILKQHRIPVAAASLGGTKRRKVRIDLAACRIYHALGDGAEEVLWRANAALPLQELKASLLCRDMPQQMMPADRASIAPPHKSGFIKPDNGSCGRDERR